MTTQVARNYKAFSFLLAGAVIMLVMSVMQKLMTNMTNIILV
jgi:hypothetical protein